MYKVEIQWPSTIYTIEGANTYQYLVEFWPINHSCTLEWYTNLASAIERMACMPGMRTLSVEMRAQSMTYSGSQIKIISTQVRKRARPFCCQYQMKQIIWHFICLSNHVHEHTLSCNYTQIVMLVIQRWLLHTLWHHMHAHLENCWTANTAL